MARLYYDGFFKLCSALLESNEEISVRSLAPFFEVARSTMQDGLKRINHIEVNIEDYDEDLIENLISWFFDPSGNTLSFYLNDEQMNAIYHIDEEVSSTPSPTAKTDKTQSKTTETDIDDGGEALDMDDAEYEEYAKKVRPENKRLTGESVHDYIARMARSKQRLQDTSRIEKAMFRNTTRAYNAMESLHSELVELLKDRKEVMGGITRTDPTESSTVKSDKVGVIQLSDLHFGELVKETINNRFDLEIAAKRLKKLVDRSKVLFKADGITNVAVLMTGDMINSTRRISEITTYADARTKVVFNAFLILGALLEDLHQDFNVTVANVVGNESRLSEYFDTTNYLVSDNFDMLVYQMLKHTHEKDGLNFVFDESNPMEQVIGINGSNFLLVHGNGHSGLARTPKIESEVEKIKARYAQNGVFIHYVLCGHIHSTYIANNYARSASIVGSNAYAERNLNFNSKASQNLFVVHKDGTIDGYMVDLQHYEGYHSYDYDRDSIMYTNDNLPSTVIIQQVFC